MIFDNDLYISIMLKNAGKLNNLKSFTLGSKNSDLKIINHKFINVYFSSI